MVVFVVVELVVVVLIVVVFSVIAFVLVLFVGVVFVVAPILKSVLNQKSKFLTIKILHPPF